MYIGDACNEMSDLCAQNLVLSEIASCPEILPAFSELGITSEHINDAISLCDQVCSKLCVACIVAWRDQMREFTFCEW